MDIYCGTHLHSVSTHATSHPKPKAYHFITLESEFSLHIRLSFWPHDSFFVHFGPRVHIFSFYAQSLWLHSSLKLIFSSFLCTTPISYYTEPIASSFWAQSPYRLKFTFFLFKLIIHFYLYFEHRVYPFCFGPRAQFPYILSVELIFHLHWTKSTFIVILSPQLMFLYFRHKATFAPFLA